METFHNRERSGYEEIVSYGPKWWTEYLEMDANYKFAGWTLDLMATFLERIIRNQFPSEADEQTLIMYERLLRIEHDAELSLEERRRIVSAYYSGSGHLSRSVILALVKAYTGQDGEVFWKDGTLCIEFNNNDGGFVSLGILQKVIERRMPAHIPFQTICTCRVSLGISAGVESWEKSFILAGMNPKTNIGLGIAREEIALKSAAEAFQMEYPNTGEEKAGVFPKISTGYGASGESVLPKINTENWSITYPVCGDDFEL